MEKKKFKLGLVPKLIIAIIIGILFGQFLPTGFCRFVVTLSGFFSTYLKFIIPLMILAYVTMGIADLSQGAGQLLLITVALAYGSTLLAGTASYLVSSNLFPHFMTSGALDQIAATADASLKPYFSLTITPLFDTLSAVVLAFILGLCLSTMKGKEIGNSLYNGMSDFSTIIDKVLHKTIIPLLPLYICGTFTDMTKSGKTFAILGILWKVFLVVIIMHFVCITIQFIIAGSVSKKNPFSLIKNQVPGYTTALGTQSSAATIPVNLECAKNDGVSAQIRNFVVPLCANIHMAGSIITITACATAVCLMNQLPISLATVIPFIMTLGVAMVASPGAPGGSIMTALPFLYMVFGTTAGDTNGPICALMVALYITQDSSNINKWGILQYFDTLQKGENGQAKADALLKLYNKKTRNLKITNALGDNRVRAGSMVVINLDLGDMKVKNWMLVEKCKHTYKEGEHWMDLTLRGGEFIA